MEEILLAEPRGFCAGVDRAIEIVERALALHGAPVYVHHEIVHNRYVVDGLRAKGAVFVEELDEVPDGQEVALGVVVTAAKEKVSKRGGRLAILESELSDYRQVGGVTMPFRIRDFVDGTLVPFPVTDKSGRALPDSVINSNKLLKDRDGGIWFATGNGGASRAVGSLGFSPELVFVLGDEAIDHALIAGSLERAASLVDVRVPDRVRIVESR